MMLSIPSTPEELTAAWLSEALRESGYLQSGRIERASVEVLDPSKGIYGTLVRLHLKYSGDSEDLPETIVAKIPSSNSKAIEFLRMIGGDRSEVSFYQQIGKSIGLLIPECFFSALDETTGRFVLLLEDLSRYRSPSPADGLTATEICSVVRALAASHAIWWQNPRLAELSWLRDLTADSEHIDSRFLAAWPIVADRLGGGSPGIVSIGEEIARTVRNGHEGLASPPVTLLHMDVRQENLFFAGDDENPTPVFIDWQVLRSGRGAASLASFLAFLPERALLEDDLITLYHAELERSGVHDYPFDECRKDYRTGILRRFTLPTSILASVDPDSLQGTAILDLLSRFGMANLERYLNLLSDG